MEKCTGCNGHMTHRGWAYCPDCHGTGKELTQAQRNLLELYNDIPAPEFLRLLPKLNKRLDELSHKK